MKHYLSIFLCLLLCACDSPDTSWFPLKQGYWWQYSVTRSIRGESRQQRLVEANLAPTKIDGQLLYPKKRPDGTVEYFQRQDGAIYRVDPADSSRTLVLMEPVEVGNNWEALSRIRFLEVTGAFEATYNRKIKEDILVNYQVESIDDTVTVPAGRFTNCIRVKGTGSLYGGGGSLKEFMAIDTISIETIDWYAPGVGLVKRMRKEFTYPLQFENNYVKVLEKFRAG